MSMGECGCKSQITSEGSKSTLLIAFPQLVRVIDFPLKQSLWEKRSHISKRVMMLVDHMSLESRPCDFYPCITEKGVGGP